MNKRSASYVNSTDGITGQPQSGATLSKLHDTKKPRRRRRVFLLLYESSGRTIRGRTMPGAAHFFDDELFGHEHPVVLPSL